MKLMISRNGLEGIDVYHDQDPTTVSRAVKITYVSKYIERIARTMQQTSQRRLFTWLRGKSSGICSRTRFDYFFFSCLDENAMIDVILIFLDEKLPSSKKMIEKNIKKVQINM